VDQKIADRQVEKVAEVAQSEARPISDVRASAGYRTQLVQVLVKRAIQKMLE
jgi:carbon-monoxide dehydrogenase medium subunit